jgi:hypothetical protein
MTAGYCLVHLPIHRLRSVIQIPYCHIYFGEQWLKNTAEFTGYFITGKKYGFFFTLHLVLTILSHKADRFVYSYPVAQKGLARYYGWGSPTRLYSGPPEPLDGHTGDMKSEHVEVLTKWGIVKIFLNRTKKLLRRGRGGKHNN